MPYGIPIGSVLEIRLRSTFFGQTVLNLFHYQNDVAYDDGDAALGAALTDFDTVVWSAIGPQLSAQITNVVLDGQWVHPTRFRVRSQPPTPNHGTNANTTTQTGTSCVVRRFGQEANRHNQGRIYVYGIPTNEQGDGQWTNAFLTGGALDLRDAVKAVIQTTIGENLNPIVWSPQDAAARRLIIGSYVDPVIRYQRRRELGVGR